MLRSSLFSVTLWRDQDILILKFTTPPLTLSYLKRVYFPTIFQKHVLIIHRGIHFSQKIIARRQFRFFQNLYPIIYSLRANLFLPPISVTIIKWCLLFDLQPMYVTVDLTFSHKLHCKNIFLLSLVLLFVLLSRISLKLTRALWFR
jgi:hypothetical protein